jgi:biotin carboxylase
VKLARSIIYVGGSGLQLPGIGWAKELGLRVVLTDRAPHPPGAALADEHHSVDGNDVPAMLDVAGRVARESELVGIYGGSDFALPAVAEVSRAHGLPACSPDAVRRALDKAASRAAWERADLALPRGVAVRDEAGLAAARAKLGLPLIVKPRDSSGSRGVRSVWRDDELAGAFRAATKLSAEVVVEELVRGDHVDVNGLFVDGRFLPCGIFDRHFCDPPYHYPTWGNQPGSLTPDREGEAYRLLEEAARALGIDTGPVKCDGIWTDRGLVLLELAPRFHGDVCTSYVTPPATGTNPIGAWLARLAGDPDPLRFLEGEGSGVAGWMGLFPQEPGRLTEIRGVDDARRFPGISEIYLRARPGSVLKRAEDNTALLGFVWGTAESKDALYENLSRAATAVDFLVDPA